MSIGQRIIEGVSVRAGDAPCSGLPAEPYIITGVPARAGDAAGIPEGEAKNRIEYGFAVFYRDLLLYYILGRGSAAAEMFVRGGLAGAPSGAPREISF
jgi:hypothetical protein